MTRLVRAPMFASLLGCALLVRGLLLDARRTLFAYLTAYVVVTTIAVGAIFFVSIAHTTGAGWMVVLRRRAEDIASVFPALAFLFVPVALGLHLLYPWAAPPGTWSEEVRAQLAPRLAYLNSSFFVARAIVYLVSWTVIAELLRRASRRQDTSSSPALAERQRTLSAATLPWMAFTLTFAAFDWLMSLDATWSSNVFGIYVFAGSFGAMGGLLSLLAFGPFPSRVTVVTPGHTHALGRILLAFVIVWAYIAFTQYLLLWIADIPEEAAWVKLRTTGGWGTLAIVLAIGHFALPFGALLSRELKRRAVVVSSIGAWLVLAHGVDVYWVVLPQVARAPAPQLVDMGAFLFVGGVATLVGIVRAGREAEVPAMDPALARGLRYEEVA